MSYDWFVDFEVQNQSAIDNCVGGRDLFDKVDIYSRTKLLATCLNKSDIKNYAKSGDRIKDFKGHKLIILNKYNSLIQEEIDRLKALNIYIPSVEISTVPYYSFFLQFAFTLATPYISKDDEEFYICDNTIRKDKVFKVPIVSGSTWKGNMRWTARQVKEIDPDKSDDKVLIRLFGNEKKEEHAFCRGRLSFYPTFFDKISLEVINPHDRKTKAGTVPIYIESVPAGASGTFSLLYVPFDLMGKSSEEVKQQVSEDINLVYNSLKEMMLTYGFSAKKSCGFGVTEKDINGIFEMSGNKDKKPTNPEPGQPTQTKKKKTYSTFSELLDSIQPTKQANSLTFFSFEKLKDIINQVKAEVMKNAG